MKRGLSILITLALLLTAAGSSLAESTTASADATASATQTPSGEMRYTGLITAVDGSSITVSVMGGNGQPNGNGPQNGGNQTGTSPQENGAPSNKGDQTGGGPQGGNGQGGDAPQGNGGNNGQNGNAPQGGSQAGSDSTQSGNGDAQQGGTPGDNGAPPEAQTMTIALTDATVITSQETGAALAAADLAADMMVIFTVSGDAASGYTALTIEVQASLPAPMEGAPTDTSTSNP